MNLKNVCHCKNLMKVRLLSAIICVFHYQHCTKVSLYYRHKLCTRQTQLSVLHLIFPENLGVSPNINLSSLSLSSAEISRPQDTRRNDCISNEAFAAFLPPTLKCDKKLLGYKSESK